MIYFAFKEKMMIIFKHIFHTCKNILSKINYEIYMYRERYFMKKTLFCVLKTIIYALNYKKRFQKGHYILKTFKKKKERKIERISWMRKARLHTPNFNPHN